MDETRARNVTILVVEDYEDILLTMRLTLEEQGYRILEASDGEQAVETAARERPDIILMDLHLPVLDGLSATRRIRENPELKNVIIVAVTAFQDQDNRAQALAAGCNAFVSKPIDFDWLDGLLGNLLA
ncbi:MAG TPA: response regulator [Pyrinomonadaceae bacterium]|jgi:CheY-like chemotaxis protein|nr:response regulator [Pyrinomonadaceae bacterium]